MATASGKKIIVAYTLKWPSGLVCLATCIKKEKKRELNPVILTDAPDRGGFPDGPKRTASRVGIGGCLVGDPEILCSHPVLTGLGTLQRDINQSVLKVMKTENTLSRI